MKHYINEMNRSKAYMRRFEKNIIPVKQIIPGYAFILLTFMVLLNGASYFGTKLLTQNSIHYKLSTPLDQLVPFLPVFIVPYILAFAQWGIGYVMISWEGRSYAYRFYSAEMIAKIACCVTFLILPTTIHRPLVLGGDLFSKAVSLMYSMDSPYNLFPSIHCLESWFCFRGVMGMEIISKKVKVAMGIMTLLVFASTVCLKQHFLVDIAGAVLYAEAALFITSFVFRER